MTMKKLMAAFIMLVSSGYSVAGLDCRFGVDHKHPACYGYYQVQHRHYNHYHNRPVVVHRHNDWVGPAIVTVIGGAVIADIITRNRNETVVVQQPQVIQQTQTCGPWIETQNVDGSITRTRSCTQ